MTAGAPPPDVSVGPAATGFVGTLRDWLARSLKTRLILATLIVFVIGVWTLTLYADWVLHKELQRSLGEQAFSTASLLAAQVNRDLETRLKALETIAAGVDPADLERPAAIQKFLEERPLLRNLFNGGALVLRRDGTAIADVLITTGRIGVNYHEIDSVAAALEEGRSTVGLPVIGKKLRTPVFGMAVPIRDRQGRVVGALRGVVNLAKPNFLQQAMEQRYGQTGGYQIVASQTRTIVAATDTSRIMEKLPAPGVNPQIDRFIQGFEGAQLLVNARGVRVLDANKGIPVAGWGLGAVLPAAEAFAPVSALQRRIMLATLVLTLLTGILVWWIVQNQFVPVRAAVEAMSRLPGSGEFLQPLPILKPDEIGVLIGAINRLLADVRNREKELKASETRHRTVIETAADGFWRADRRGRLLEVNQAYSRMSGYSAQELLAMGIPDLEAAETATDVSARLQKIAAQGHDRFKSRHRRKDGSVFDVEVTVQNQPGTDGQIVVFSRDITERRLAEEQIVRSLREKEVLLREIHHRVKNNMQVLASLLELQADALTDETARALLEESRARIHAMALIHETLYLSEDLATVDFSEYLRRLLGDITAIYDRPGVDCAVDMAALTLNVNTGVPCGLIVNELVSNSLKHAFPDDRPGTIRVGITRDGAGNNVLVVADNGIGLPPGQDVRTARTLGLRLVAVLTKQIHGTLEIESGAGTTFRITFPGS